MSWDTPNFFLVKFATTNTSRAKSWKGKNERFGNFGNFGIIFKLTKLFKLLNLPLSYSPIIPITPIIPIIPEHIPRRGGGLGVGQAWNCLRRRQVSRGLVEVAGYLPYYGFWPKYKKWEHFDIALTFYQFWILNLDRLTSTTTAPKPFEAPLHWSLSPKRVLRQ